tara:strand:+ start:1213 stop:1338 length:126 start_codon:yes stop_codon:yes gene_type:complete
MKRKYKGSKKRIREEKIFIDLATGKPVPKQFYENISEEKNE